MAPQAAAQDALYFAEIDNCRARAVDLVTGTITTCAGSGELGIGRPAGSSSEQMAIEGAAVTVGDKLPALEAKLSARPMRLAVDVSTGDILIIDAHQCRVRRVEDDGIMTTVAGDGSVGYAGDGGAGGAATEASAAPKRRSNARLARLRSHCCSASSVPYEQATNTRTLLQTKLLSYVYNYQVHAEPYPGRRIRGKDSGFWSD